MSSTVTLKKCIAVAFPVAFASTSALLAFHLRDIQLKYRWLLGSGLIYIYNTVNTFPFLRWSYLIPDSMNLGICMGLWLCSAFTGFFGGNAYYKKHGIDNQQKVLISSLCCGQCYFHSKSDDNISQKRMLQRYKSLLDLVKFTAAFATGHGIAKYLLTHPTVKMYIESHLMLNLEVSKLLIALSMQIFNVPSIIHGIIFGGEYSDFHLEVVKPYDFTYFS